ncbi:MAG TPA: bifunctional 4-hydroxy-2-oxoglutarate aldolase/2-dehydro-3-deoxy-phosphogluconate aldolase [Steroidobacteraceae bacterium]|jgi:2-dehydro-3-deoxyphosphogluconate aldolase/(4S)-4-hydroxy-2-oxoglutarate aldolase|nr:bifunctional 4-hydroxy-2-oxoglutarate aldolase/2-dehydro-3-deoxy-phosphogluconate aldolase [Steroidobacteraceae bacterium]
MTFNIRQLLAIAPVIPVIRIDNVEHAVPMAQALVAGGLRVLEVTLRTPVALSAIERIRASVPDAIVGAGTLQRPADFKSAAVAGAQFAVTPGLTAALVEAAREVDYPLLPGVMTPSELLYAAGLGYHTLKLFPAEQAGGVRMLSALGGPFPEVLFCPTGGVTLENAPSYLALKNVGCVGGSWLTTPELMSKGDWRRIEALARESFALRPTR